MLFAATVRTKRSMPTEARHIVDLLVEQLYKLSSTQINLPAAHADYLIKWGRLMIPNEHLYYDDKGGLGREDEPHISVLYGLTGAEPSPKLLELIRKTPPFTVKLTSVTLFDNNPDYDVVKFDVDSDELKALSDAIRQACPNENKFPEFHGHATVAYVKKGRALDVAGNYPFQQNPPISAEFEVNEIIFKPAGDSGDPNRKPIRIPLNRYRQEAEDPKAVFKKIPRPPDFTFRSEGSVVLITPNHPDADKWLHDTCPEDAQFFGGSMVVEPRYMTGVAIAMADDGWITNVTLHQEAEDPKKVFKALPRAKEHVIAWQDVYGKTHCVTMPAATRAWPDMSLADAKAKVRSYSGFKRIVRAKTRVIEETEDNKKMANVGAPIEDPKIVLKKAKEAKSRKDNGGVQVLPPTRGRLLPARPVRLMGEAETPQMAMKLKRITRALMFKHVPEGFYFRSPWYPLVKKQLDPESGCNAVTADLDMVRPLKFPPDYWVFPVEWTTNDITTGQRIESLTESRSAPQERTVYGPEGLDEAEDPKATFRLAKAANKKWVMTRVTDAYGNALRDVHYLHYYGKAIDGPPVASWTYNFTQATQFSSEAEAWQTMRDCFGDDLLYFKGGVSADPLNPIDVNPQRFKPRHEAEDPKATLKQSAQDVFVVWAYYAGVPYFLRLEKRWGDITYMWAQEQHMASRFRTQEAAQAFKDEFYPGEDHNIRVSTMGQALAYRGESEDPRAFLMKHSRALTRFDAIPVGTLFMTKSRKFHYRKVSDTEMEDLGDGTIMAAGRGWLEVIPESEDPKHFLKTVAGTLPEKRFRVNWLDQHGNIHYTSFGVPSEEIAIEHLKHNLAHNWSRAYELADIICVDDISSLKEAEDPKQAFRKATRQLLRPRLYKNVPDGFFFKFNHEDPTVCVKRGGEAFRVDNMVNPYWSKSMVNDVYVCYPASWSYEKIKAHSRHISRHPEAFKEAEDPKRVFRQLGQMVEIPLKGPGIIMGRWKGGSSDSAWSYWGDFPEGWGWSPRLNDATVLRHNQLRPTIERIQRESPDQALRVLPVHNRPRLEAREASPFDLLKFPTDASVLAAKLLDLEHDVKPAVL